ncbi:MAG: hypothetical protein R1F52_01110 [Candidatus Nitrosoabyssus spongiisocia]|nr:MAG: hypothetical protein R1F52_01110 [Nitrosopumilaceae archaeon AB1(1)]
MMISFAKRVPFIIRVTEEESKVIRNIPADLLVRVKSVVGKVE